MNRDLDLFLLTKFGHGLRGGMGYQIGNVEAKEVVNEVLHLKLWRHDAASFAKMWDQAGAETGTTWETEARLRS